MSVQDIWVFKLPFRGDGRHGLFQRGILQSFFSLRLHPNTSRRGSARTCGKRSGLLDLTPSSLLRPSRRRMAVSIR